MSKNLEVRPYGNSEDIRVSHRNLAEFLDLRQGDVRDLIERHIGEFEQISPCPFETEMAELGLGTRREVKVYYLDSDQANFLVTLTKPTEASVPLKLNVVLAFREAKKALASSTPSIPRTFAEALRLAAEKEEARERAEIARIEAERKELLATEARDAAVDKLQRATPALMALREMEQKKEDLTVGDYAKLLSDHDGYEIGERRLWAILREAGIVCKSSAQPTQAAINKGVMAVRKGKPWKNPKTGETRMELQAMVTVVGQIEIVRILERNGVRRRTEKDVLKTAYDDSFDMSFWDDPLLTRP